MVEYRVLGTLLHLLVSSLTAVAAEQEVAGELRSSLSGLPAVTDRLPHGLDCGSRDRSSDSIEPVCMGWTKRKKELKRNVEPFKFILITILLHSYPAQSVIASRHILKIL